MKLLTIKQPWCWCILFAGKDIENRVWQTPYRGPLLIHAGKGGTKSEHQRIAQVVWEEDGIRIPRFEDMPRGGIVGVVDLVGVVTEEDAQSTWFGGPYGLVLANPRPLPFYPMKGQLGLCPAPKDYKLPAETEEKFFQASFL